MPENDQSNLTVRTVDQKGVAPRRRIATPAAAQGAYYTLRDQGRLRDMRFADMRGNYDGFPPVPPSRMVEMGMADMPNFNLKQFQYKIDQYADTWRRVNTAGETWYDVKAFHPDPREALRRSNYLTACFNRAIRRWDSTDFCQSSDYVLQCTARDTQLGLFGIGISHFSDPIDWRWKMRPTRKVLVPPKTLITLKNCPAVYIEDEMSVPQLYSLRNKNGWNEEAVLYALYMRTNENIQGRKWTYSEWENYIRNNESWIWNTEFSPVEFVHCYVREFGDNSNEFNITHTIFVDTLAFSGRVNDRDKASKDEKKTGWLYEKPRCATRWSQVLIPFSDNPGPELEWHGVKGFGDLIFDPCLSNDLMYNRGLACSIIQNMPIFTGVDEQNRQRLNQAIFNFGSILYPDLGQLNQVKINGDIGAMTGMFELGTRLLDTISRTQPVNQQLGPEKTATQENYERMAMTEVTGLQISNYNATGNDALGAEMYRRIAQPGSKYPESYPGGNVAKLFREEAKLAGIAEQDLLQVISVKATRKGGSGSVAVDIVKGKEALAIATPGSGQLFARKMIANAMYEPDVVNSLIEEKAPPPDQEDVVISQENLSIQSGQQPTAFDFQPHEKHLQQESGNDHLNVLAGLQNVVQAIMRSGIKPNELQDAVKLHSSFDAGIGHSEQHLEFMESMPRSGERPGLYEGFVKQVRPILNNMRQLSRSFGEAIMTAQERAEQQAPTDPKMIEAMAKIERDNVLAAAEIQRKNAAHEQKLGNLAETSAVRTQIKAQQQLQDLGDKAERSALDMQTQRAKANQSLQEQSEQANMQIAVDSAAKISDIAIRQREAAQKEPKTNEQ